MRREFDLGPEDVRALDALGRPWEAIKSDAARYVLVHDHPIPPGYNVGAARMAIRVDTYPPGPLDMVYFLPPLSRSDGKAINNLSTTTIDGATYQQWSRHYAWRAGFDDLCRHLRRIRSWLTHEFLKR
ncbi:hypothetical protein XI07_13975 [Bradyrhizobium sp. CCBAU 11445]|uniref:E2/UBC family protein n=1 Tax=Bradyrhizobium sp. CCBAU 11445 TaxID=1630896 RepID=UPI002306C186|nr:E2/UBC family protein [Bradyrhizobium sp. CCBAU 11445]MDA9483112.1 hypothetical protein [Bradyrhizobium sp. CCBAU 11445]